MDQEYKVNSLADLAQRHDCKRCGMHSLFVSQFGLCMIGFGAGRGSCEGAFLSWLAKSPEGAVAYDRFIEENP